MRKVVSLRLIINMWLVGSSSHESSRILRLLETKILVIELKEYWFFVFELIETSLNLILFKYSHDSVNVDKICKIDKINKLDGLIAIEALEFYG